MTNTDNTCLSEHRNCRNWPLHFVTVYNFRIFIKSLDRTERDFRSSLQNHELVKTTQELAITYSYIKVVPKKREKVEYERERLIGKD